MQVELPARGENYSLCVSLVLVRELLELEVGTIDVLKSLEISAQVHIQGGRPELLRRVDDRSDDEFFVWLRVDQTLGDVDIRKEHKPCYAESGRSRSSA